MTLFAAQLRRELSLLLSSLEEGVRRLVFLVIGIMLFALHAEAHRYLNMEDLKEHKKNQLREAA